LDEVVSQLLKFLDEVKSFLTLLIQDLVFIVLNEVRVNVLRLETAFGDSKFLENLSHAAVDFLPLCCQLLEFFELLLLPHLLLLFLSLLQLVEGLLLLLLLQAFGSLIELLGEHLEVLLLLQHVVVLFKIGVHSVSLLLILLLEALVL